ncbi:MAG TPA: class I SAM-dependent methyltransferase [Acidimicrobiales bacterium]|nr:class I SAM-dependent methyltransferase [Acidimicrobiales bacterium]
MSVGGTASYEHEPDLPDLVRRAVELARTRQFEFSCRPPQGRLLSILAAARSGGRIGETGTGCGVGLAWMVSSADSSTTFVSAELDADRAAAAATLFAAHANVTVLGGDWRQIRDHGPFDLLVLDGGGSGKTPGDEPVDPQALLRPGGGLVIDDFTPWDTWPPMMDGDVDHARLHWLEHPDLLASEIQVHPHMSTIVAVRRN